MTGIEDLRLPGCKVENLVSLDISEELLSPHKPTCQETRITAWKPVVMGVASLLPDPHVCPRVPSSSVSIGHNPVSLTYYLRRHCQGRLSITPHFEIAVGACAKIRPYRVER